MPVTFTDAIVTVELPLFVSVTFCELLLPTATLPNAMPDVLALSDSVLATPVPESAIEVGELAALLTNETEPDAAPIPDGPNATVNVLLAPALIVAGTANPEMLNPAPDAVACEIVRLALPVF